MPSRRHVLASLLALPGAAVFAQSGARAATAPGGGVAIRGAPKYPAGFPHFDYVNAAAPKGGTLIVGEEGTFDTFNPYVLKGAPEWWSYAYDPGFLNDSLMTRAADEPLTAYPLIARGATMAEDRAWLEIELDERARFHDGSPIGVGDVLFSFDQLREHGRPHFREILKRIAKTATPGKGTIRLDFEDAENLGLPLSILTDLPIVSERYWAKRDFAKPSLDPPVASGPYRVRAVDGGRSVVYERVRDHWAAALPVNVGHNNFDTVRVEKFLDAALLAETVKSGDVDLRVENSASKWALAYDGAALRAGTLIRHRISHHIPQGMQGFVFNTRRELLSDWRVRRALALVFDFEWANKNLMHTQYTRTASYFANSDMASSGLPAGAELRILERFRGRIPDRVFTAAYELPVFAGDGDVRGGLRAAFALLKEAGWVVRDMKLVEASSGRRLGLEFLIDNDAWVRLCLPYLRTLRRLGVDAHLRRVDDAQYQNRVRDYDFDVIVVAWGASFAPGTELTSQFTSKVAERPGSENYAGLKDRVVDALVKRIQSAREPDDLVASCRALDRLLLHHHLVVPHWHITYDRVVHWDKFGYAKPTMRGSSIMTWWVDPAKAAALRGRIRSLR